MIRKIVGSTRLPPEDLPHRALSSVGLRFCFFGQFSTEGTEVKSASVTQTEVELYEKGNWYQKDVRLLVFESFL